MNYENFNITFTNTLGKCTNLFISPNNGGDKEIHTFLKGISTTTFFYKHGFGFR